MAEVMGAEQMIFVKDVDGVYDKDPARHDDATFLKEVSTTELLSDKFDDLPIERELVRSLENARTLKSVRVINGLKPEQLKAALEGKDVGTLVYSTRYEK